MKGWSDWKGAHRTHNVISSLNHNTRNVSAVIIQVSVWDLEESTSENYNIHLVNLLFLQKLSVAHESLVSGGSALTLPSGLNETYVVDEIVVLYPGKCTKGTTWSLVPRKLEGLRNRRTLPSRLFPLPPGKLGRRTTSKWPSYKIKPSAASPPIPQGQTRTPIATMPWQHSSSPHRLRN